MEISQKTLEFVKKHANDDTNTLRLKYSGINNPTDSELSLDFALVQIEARRKSKKKIPSFLRNPLFLFPDAISSEQASNEIIANFHASLLKNCDSLLDLTAGLGIDDLTYALSGIEVTACEIDENKADTLIHNAGIFGVENCLHVINQDSIAYIKECNRKFDVVFADPARRSGSGRRVHAFSNCSPNIMEVIPYIWKISDRLVVKSSPLLDLTSIRSQINDLYHIYILCVKGECKEVMIEMRRRAVFKGFIVADLDENGTISHFSYDPEQFGNLEIRYADRPTPADYKYLYEPNAGVMKTGAWNVISSLFPSIFKADPNTHVFFSDSLYKDFPGRIIEIGAQPDKKTLKTMKGDRFNVVARNHPLSAPDIAKKYSLLSATDSFLYALRYKGTPVIVTGKIQK